MPGRKLSPLLLLVLLLPTAVAAQQRLEMEGTAIIGNKELPNVLYIVPWKSAKPVNLQAPPFTSVLDEVLTPIERANFRQQVNYYHELYPPKP